MNPFIPPQIPTASAEPPIGSEWIHEVKHDGFRTMIVVDRGTARAFTRKGYDWTDRYQPIVDRCAALGCETAILDGEMVVEDERGITDFAALKPAMARAPHRLVFHAFDLLRLDDADLRPRPLLERRAALARLIVPDSPALRYSSHFEGDGHAFFSAAVKLGLEGIVSKRVESRYRSGPSRAWLKIKNMTESELIVLGIGTDRDGRLFVPLAWPDREELEPAGAAYVALPAEEREALVAAVGDQVRVRVRHLNASGPLRHATVRAIVS